MSVSDSCDRLVFLVLVENVIYNQCNKSFFGPNGIFIFYLIFSDQSGNNANNKAGIGNSARLFGNRRHLRRSNHFGTEKKDSGCDENSIKINLSTFWAYFYSKKGKEHL